MPSLKGERRRRAGFLAVQRAGGRLVGPTLPWGTPLITMVATRCVPRSTSPPPPVIAHA